MTRRLHLLLAGALLGCSADPLTELVVVINSDMSIPAEFDGFRVVVSSHDGQQPTEVSTDRKFFLGEEPGKVRLPADFGIMPRDGDASRRVQVDVYATQGDDLFYTRAVTGFVEGKTLRLDMFLARRCLTEAAECKENETCRVDGCVPEAIDPETLPEFDPNAPLADQNTWLVGTGSEAGDFWLETDIDSAGNVYAAGVHEGDLSVGGSSYPTTTPAAMVGSFDPTGKLRWFKSYQATTLASAGSVAASGGRVYVTGWFGGQMTVDGELLDSGSGQDSFLAAYDDGGQKLWVKTFGGSGNIQSKNVSVAPNGDVGIVGVYPNQQSLGGPDLPATRGDDVFVARFDSAGGHIFSTGFGGADHQDRGWKVAFDSQSNMIVGGSVSSGTVDFGGKQVTFSGTTNAFVLKYDTSGVLAWVRTFENGSPQAVFGLAVGKDDRVAVACDFEGAIDFGGGVLQSQGGNDAAVAVFDADGGHLFSTSFGGAGPDRADKVRFLGDSVVVAGRHSGDVGFGGATILGAPDQNAFVLALSPDLQTVQWAHSLGGAGDDAAAGLSVGTSAVVVAGEYAQTLTFGNSSAAAVGGDKDAFLLHFVP